MSHAREQLDQAAPWLRLLTPIMLAVMMFYLYGVRDDIASMRSYIKATSETSIENRTLIRVYHGTDTREGDHLGPR